MCLGERKEQRIWCEACPYSCMILPWLCLPAVSPWIERMCKKMDDMAEAQEIEVRCARCAALLQPTLAPPTPPPPPPPPPLCRRATW